MYPASAEHLNRQQIIPNWGGGLWEQRYILFFPFFSFCECVCVCFCVWFCLYTFAFIICPRVLSVRFFFCFFFSIVFRICYHWWISFLVWLLSSFFPFFYYFINFLIIICIFYFNKFILFYFILSSFFLSFFFFSLLFWAVWMTGSWCSSQASGLCLWGGRAKFRTLVHRIPPSST